MTLLVGLDTETHLIREGDIIPRLVCLTVDSAEAGLLSPTTNILDTYKTGILTNGDRDLTPLQMICDLWQAAYEGRAHIIIHNAAFDVTVVMRYCMDVASGAQVGDKALAKATFLLLWDVLDRGLDEEMAGRPHFVHDTLIREKLWMLSTVGNFNVPGEKKGAFTLAKLVGRHFDVDISGKKVESGADGRVWLNGKDITGTALAGDIWRLRYSELDGVPIEKWPEAAVSYAIDDATWARKVYVSQETRRQPEGFGSINSESLQVYADVCLRLSSSLGFGVDKPRVAKVQEAVNQRLEQTNGALKLNGVVRPNDTVNQAILHERIIAAWRGIGAYPVLTDTGRISAGGEVLETLAPHDPILHLYQQRAEVMKIQSSFLPNLQGSRVYTNYNILVETGRTSSYGASDDTGRKPLYAAVNIQQIPKDMGARQCFMPPEPLNGVPYVFYSGDYGAQELCSVAQVTYSLFGHSVHRDRINAGYDLHTFLGSSLAMVLEPEAVGFATEIEAAYKELNRRRKLKPEDLPEHERAEAQRQKDQAVGWRNLAKPVGLGYPGGLGPETCCVMAKGDYGINMTIDQATTFREIWRRTYPEMIQAFAWVNRQKDNSDAHRDAHCYETQGFRRFRAGATYCATANGKLMQSLSSDGSKRSVCWLGRACAGGLPPESPYSILDDCFPAAFIHDENIIAMPLDLLTTERALLAGKLMVTALQVHMPDVLLTVGPTIMHRWNKKAEDKWADQPARAERVYDALNARGRLYGVANFADIVADELGSSYNPTKALLTWDDAT